MNTDIIKRNNVKISGKGAQTIVFAAGFGCDQNMWRFVAPSFEKDYCVILFDYVGAGRSDIHAYDLSKYNTLHGYAQDIIDVLTALDLQNVIFVGHSVSCMIGLLASIERPDLFERMVMIGPSPCYENDPPSYFGGFERETLVGLIDMMEKNYIGWANYLAPVIMKNTEKPELAGELEESFCSTDPLIAHNFAKATFFSDNRQDLPKAVVPALILQCKEDTIAPTEVGEYVHKHMPHSTLRYMEATGHSPHMSHPEETINLIKEYLSVETHIR